MKISYYALLDAKVDSVSVIRYLPVAFRNVFHFWTETISVVATVTAITEQ